jgi:hypothetical protein
MNAFVQQHLGSVIGLISGWDRLRFRGTLRMLAHVSGLDRFLGYTGHLLKDFGKYALDVSQKVRGASLAQAQAAGRPVVHLDSPSVCKEDMAREIQQRDGIKEGLICVLTAVEGCWSYDIRSNRQSGTLELIRRFRKCQHLYHYFVHPVFGFMHVRLQTWLPFNLFPCLNGREWLGWQMDAAGIGYQRVDNCFPWIADLAKAQELALEQVHYDWTQALDKLALQVNPALPSILGGYRIGYYWSLDQSEWATDVMFKDPRELARLYPGLLRHGMESFGSKEVMRFLGRSVERGITPRFGGDVTSDIAVKAPGRWFEGMRIKHRVNRNSVKMYNKAASVLRVETTLNDMHDMQAPRVVEGKKVYRRMRKGVADMPRRAEVSDKSNTRYLEAVAAVATAVPLKSLTAKLSRPVRWKNKSVRGLNLLGEEDATLLAAVGQGKFLISGLRNRDLQELLYAQPAQDPAQRRRRCGQVTRKLRMLRAHGLIRKVPHTHRYQVTDKGRQVIAALHAAREADIAKLTRAA